MLPRKQRLSQREFSRVWGKGKTTPSPFFVVRSLKSSDANTNNAYAVVVSKKVNSQAVARNKMRRLVYSAIAESIPQGVGLSIIVVVRKDIRELSKEELKRELSSPLSNI